MELDQEKLMEDHSRDIKVSFTKLEKRDEELEIMKVNHFNQVAVMQNHSITMEENHKEMSSIQVDYDKVIKNMNNF